MYQGVKMLTEAVEGLCEPRVSGLQSLEAAEAVIKKWCTSNKNQNMKMQLLF